MLTQPTTSAPAGRAEPADPTKAASWSMVISGIRCVLAYVVFPWILPAAGRAGSVGPAIGLAVGVVAIAFNIASILRFQRAGHRWRWPVTVVNSGVIVLVTILAIRDISDLLG